MRIRKYIPLYLVSILVFFGLDLLWLGVVAKRFYNNQMGDLMRADVLWAPAIIFYLLFVAGVVVFVTLPALQSRSGRTALLRGAFFGLVTYATFDLTSLALVADFPAPMVPVDLLWGMLLSAAVAYAGFRFERRRLPQA